MPRADRAALELLSRLKLADPPIDLVRIAADLDVVIVAEEWDEGDDVSGMIVRDDNHRVIGVNKRHAPTRRRFTIAHEFGHLILHAGKPVILDRARVNFRDAVSGMGTDLEEMQANAFAAELLMPAEMIRSHAKRLAADHPEATGDQFVRRLARQFAVSPEAMEYRLTNLGIIWR